MAQDRTALIHRALRNLGALPQGQSPSAEESQSIDDLIDPTVANLASRNIISRDVDPDYLEDEYFIPLAHVLAAVAAPEFGQAQDQAIWALKERAEIDLKYMYDQFNRLQSGQPRNMRTDYPFAVTCRSTWSFTMGNFIKPATQYVTVAASQTTAPVGIINSYLESVTVIPASTAAGAVTILDGSTNIVVIPTLAGTGTGTVVPSPFCVQLGIRATSASTGFKITTGAAVSVIAVGRFTA